MFFTSSKSSSSDNRVAAADEARALGLGAQYSEGFAFGDHNVTFGDGGIATSPLATGSGGGTQILFIIGAAMAAAWLLWYFIKGGGK